jgi:hypothetical protein
MCSDRRGKFESNRRLCDVKRKQAVKRQQQRRRKVVDSKTAIEASGERCSE